MESTGKVENYYEHLDRMLGNDSGRKDLKDLESKDIAKLGADLINKLRESGADPKEIEVATKLTSTLSDDKTRAYYDKFIQSPKNEGKHYDKSLGRLLNQEDKKVDNNIGKPTDATSKDNDGIRGAEQTSAQTKTSSTADTTTKGASVDAPKVDGKSVENSVSGNVNAQQGKEQSKGLSTGAKIGVGLAAVAATALLGPVGGLAVIGLAFAAKKGYDMYQDHKEQQAQKLSTNAPQGKSGEMANGKSPALEKGQEQSKGLSTGAKIGVGLVAVAATALLGPVGGLAVIGLAFAAKKGYDKYQEYQENKKQTGQEAATNASPKVNEKSAGISNDLAKALASPEFQQANGSLKQQGVENKGEASSNSVKPPTVGKMQAASIGK